MIYKKKKVKKKSILSRTRLGQVAGVSTEAIRTDADKWIIPDSRHTCCPIVADIHLTVVTWGKRSHIAYCEYGGKEWNPSSQFNTTAVHADQSIQNACFSVQLQP